MSAPTSHIHLALGLTRWLGSLSSGKLVVSTTPSLVNDGSVLELAAHRAVGDGLADLRLQAGDRAGLVGLERLLHLHRLDDDDGVALGDLLALLDDDLDDGALHRAGDRVAAGGGPGLLAAAPLRLLGATAGGREPTQTGGQHDLDPPATDLHGHLLPLALVLGLGGLAGVGLDLVVEVGLDPGR